MSPDPFDTGGLRSAVLEAWRRSPARLREDANTEEDHARGYYRDRVVIELAQNAADAATRAGEPGHLRVRLTRVGGRTVLLAANTGAPLDAAGVAALASMRASAKRDQRGTVGRFGVGFAAVRAVADEILAVTADGAVRFSLARSRAVLAAEPALAEELERRGDAIPVLRLPFDAQGVADAGPALDHATARPSRGGAVPDASASPDSVLALARRALAGHATVIALELRDDVAVATVRSLLGEVGDPLLLALPALAEITIETPDGAFAVADVTERWHVARGSGTLDPALLADRPVEERSDSGWQVTWAVPRAGAGSRVAGSEIGGPKGATGVILAPTPTQEPLTLPALLVATLPLDPTRRHVARGLLTDALVRAAGSVYAELGAVLADAGRSPLDLVPVGLPAGDLDARLREAALEALAAAPVLGGDRVAPRDASAISGEPGQDPAVVGALARATENLVLLAPGEESRAAALGVRLRPVGDVVDELAALPSPADWRALYDVLAPVAADSAVRESLGAIGVPLADGRTVRGARGTVIVHAEREVVAAAEALAAWGVRIVHPVAEHPLLERLGARVVDAAGLLAEPGVRAAVEAGADDDDAAADVFGAVLDIATRADELPAWISGLHLPEDGGGFAPARELVLPGSTDIFDPEIVGTLEREVAERWVGLDRLGVLTGLKAAVVGEVATGPTLLDAADVPPPAAWEDYLGELTDRLGPDVELGDVEVVLDLDAVLPGSWPEALRLLDSEPALHRAVTRRVRGFDSYVAWWLRHESPEELELGDPFAIEGAAPGLDRILRPAPAILAGRSEEIQRALGGVRSLAGLDGEEWAHLDLGDAGDPVDPATARAVWDALAELDQDGPWEGPALVPAVVGPDRIELVRPADAVVVTARPWLARADVAPSLTAGEARWELRSLARPENGER